MKSGKLLTVKRGLDNDPYLGQTILDMTFTSTSMINKGTWNVTPAYPRGFLTTLGVDGNYGFDCNSNRYIQLPYTGDLSPTLGAVTIEFWFIRRGGSYGALFAQDRYGANFDRCMILYNDSVRSMGAGTSWIIDAPTSGAITGGLNKPMHGAFVKKGANHKVFLDGVKYIDSDRAWGDSGNPMTIGAASWNSPNSFFDGLISRVRVTTGARYS